VGSGFKSQGIHFLGSKKKPLLPGLGKGGFLVCAAKYSQERTLVN